MACFSLSYRASSGCQASGDGDGRAAIQHDARNGTKKTTTCFAVTLSLFHAMGGATTSAASTENSGGKHLRCCRPCWTPTESPPRGGDCPGFLSLRLFGAPARTRETIKKTMENGRAGGVVSVQGSTNLTETRTRATVPLLSTVAAKKHETEQQTPISPKKRFLPPPPPKGKQKGSSTTAQRQCVPSKHRRIHADTHTPRATPCHRSPTRRKPRPTFART